MTSPPFASHARRLTPRCRGGVSSLLRLSRAGAARQGSGFADLAAGTAQALRPFVETDFGESDPLYTTLVPSPGVLCTD